MSLYIVICKPKDILLIKYMALYNFLFHNIYYYKNSKSKF